MEKSYIIQRRVSGEVVVMVVEGILNVDLTSDSTPYRLTHIAYHSRTGFEVGYPGSGPADLALSILVDLLNGRDEAQNWMPGKAVPARAQMYHQRLKWFLFAGMKINPGNETIITEGAIRAWMARNNFS